MEFSKLFHNLLPTIMLIGFALSLAILSILAGVIGKAGFEVDRQRYAWRNYYKTLGLTFGRWQSLPPITGVTLKYFSNLASTSSTTVGDIANWNNTVRKNEQLILMLSVADSNQGIVLRKASITELITVRILAKEIAHELGVLVREFLPVGTET